MYSLVTHSFEDTEQFGEKLAESLLHKRFFIALFGDIGAGKTVFVRGMTKVLSPGSRVKSPTYTIVNEYRRGDVPLFHFDLYRIEDPDDLDGFGFDETAYRRFACRRAPECSAKAFPFGMCRA
jgi:tRNA threonylcarbamoyladenosine biosynthesis protein TsaE